MTFVVLPLLTSDLHRAALLSATALVPGVINMVLSTGGFQRAGDVTAFVCQLMGIIVWPVLVAVGHMNYNIHLVRFKVRCGWLLVAMYLRPLSYAETTFQISRFYVKAF